LAVAGCLARINPDQHRRALIERPLFCENNMADQDSSSDDDGSIWVIYESPDDFPNKYVARRLYLNRPTLDFVVGDTLIDVRTKLPKGLFRIERSDRDDPQVRESWI
jgi:hypothetical protein